MKLARLETRTHKRESIVMSITQVVLEIANEYATSLDRRIPTIQRELADIEAQKAQTEAQLDSASKALNRSREFPLLLRREPICPYCWIDSGRRDSLRALDHAPDDDPRLDIFRCSSCERTFAA
jgi:hypothetical protein